MLRKIKLQIPGEPLAGRGPAVEKHWSRHYMRYLRASDIQMYVYVTHKADPSGSAE